MKLSPAQLTALAAFLLARFRAFVRVKGDAPEMRAVAIVFGVLAFFGAGIPTEAAFLATWWTTLGPVIYAPTGTGDLGEHLRVLVHELTHVVQFWRSPVDYVKRYLTSTGRAELEAEAERGALEVWWILTGTVPPSLESLDRTRHGYALDDGHADLTRDLLETAATSASAGVVSTDVGIEVLAWLRAHAPDAIVGRVAAAAVVG